MIIAFFGAVSYPVVYWSQATFHVVLKLGDELYFVNEQFAERILAIYPLYSTKFPYIHLANSLIFNGILSTMSTGLLWSLGSPPLSLHIRYSLTPIKLSHGALVTLGDSLGYLCMCIFWLWQTHNGVPSMKLMSVYLPSRHFFTNKTNCTATDLSSSVN